MNNYEKTLSALDCFLYRYIGKLNQTIYKDILILAKLEPMAEEYEDILERFSYNYLNNLYDLAFNPPDFIKLYGPTKGQHYDNTFRNNMAKLVAPKSSSEYQRAINKIDKIHQELLTDQEIIKLSIAECQIEIRNPLKTKLIITKHKLINNESISTEELLRLDTCFKVSNLPPNIILLYMTALTLRNQKAEQQFYDQTYLDIINILASKYYPINELPFLNSLNTQKVNSLYAGIVCEVNKANDRDELSIIFNHLSFLDADCLLSLYIKLYNSTISDLNELKNTIKIFDQIKNASERQALTDMYKRYIFKLNYFKQNIATLEAKEAEMIANEENQNIDNDLMLTMPSLPERNVIFSSPNPHDPLVKCYFENDLESRFNKENLRKIESLISDFMYGRLTHVHIKTLQDRNHFIELKDDQIRIVLYDAGKNYYLVTGGSLKKATNDMSMYDVLTSRPHNIDLTNPNVLSMYEKNSAYVLERINTYVLENQRHGSR